MFAATNGTPTISSSPSMASPVVPVASGNASSTSLSDVPRDAFASDTLAVALPASDSRNIVRRKLTGYVGFANLPNQWHRKSVRKGFNFNVMVVGTCFRGLCAGFRPNSVAPR